ncbi:unnamed protein product [Arctogadus glacialis]
MNKTLIIAVMVTLLALSAESFRMPRQAVEEEAGSLTKITDTIKSYYDGSVNTASGYIDDIRGMKLEEKVKSIYEDTTLVVSTYFGIVQDQMYFILYPQQ